MKTQGSQIFLWFAVLVLLATVGWLVWPSPYQVCHIVLTGMGRARIYPTVAKFKPYKGKTMGGSALMAAVVKEQTASFTAKAEPYCFISLGAELSGTAEGFLTKGEAIVKAFNSMNLDAMLVGNIDFSFGKERLKELAQIANFKFVASNVKNTQDGHTPDFFKDSQIINISDDIKIGHSYFCKPADDEDIEKYEKYNNKPLVVVVDDDKLSIAIGKRGKNAKLAVKLTNRKIDIKTQTEINEMGLDVDQLVLEFKADQVRIAKEKEQKKFLELQEEAIKRKAEFDAQLATEDTGFDETTIEEMDEAKVEEVDTMSQAKPVEEEVPEVKVEEPVKKEPRKPLAPKPEYKSKFEDIAGGAKKEEQTIAKKRKKKDDE